MKTIRDFDVRGKKVFVRCDFNAPLSPKGDILDGFRIEKTLPTIKYLLERGSKIILASHLGNPGNRKEEALTLDAVQKELTKYLNCPVAKTNNIVGDKAKKEVGRMEKGDILLLENLRFDKGEIENDYKFAQNLAELAEIYINEAFAVSHRFHASVFSLPRFLPSGIGFLFEQEIRSLAYIRKRSREQALGIIGGIKFESKASVLPALLNVAGTILIGGKISEMLQQKKKMLPEGEIMLPIDGINEHGQQFDIGPKTIGINEHGQQFDIGPKTIEKYSEHIEKSKTIFWAGPMGKIENERFQKGTISVAEAIGESQAFSVVGGGDTVGFLRKQGLEKRFSHVSTGGGAMLSFLARGTLPALRFMAE